MSTHASLRVLDAAEQFAVDVVAALASASGPLPGDLEDQLCRAAGSIGANIAEGFSRRTKRDRQRYLGMAEGSAREAVTRLSVCSRAGLLPARTCTRLLNRGTVIRRMIVRLSGRLRD